MNKVNSLTLPKTNFNTNKLDKVINKNIKGMNDIHVNELKITNNNMEMKEPTPVSFFNTLKQKRNKHVIVKEGLSVLFDSGSSHTIIVQDLVSHLQWKRLRNPSGFDSCNGAFDLSYKTEVMMSFPELNTHRVVTWQCYVDDRPSQELGYDMIIGRDLMTELGINIDFKNRKILWDGLELEMRDFKSKNPSSREVKAILKQAAETKETKEATSRLVKILDSTYE